MFKRFIPDYYFDTFDVASAEFLASIGVKGIVLDVDNTLEPYENPIPGTHVLAWFKSLSEHGISASIVSNNNKDRIDRFNANLGLCAFSKAKKPFKYNVVRAMEAMGTNKENTVLMGDQIFTDVWAAHNAGIRAILVPPIKDKRDPLTRFKRLLEKPILRRIKIVMEKDNGR